MFTAALPSVAAASRRCLMDQTIGKRIAQQQMISNRCRISRYLIYIRVEQQEST